MSHAFPGEQPRKMWGTTHRKRFRKKWKLIWRINCCNTAFHRKDLTFSVITSYKEAVLYFSFFFRKFVHSCESSVWLATEAAGLWVVTAGPPFPFWVVLGELHSRQEGARGVFPRFFGAPTNHYLTSIWTLLRQFLRCTLPSSGSTFDAVCLHPECFICWTCTWLVSE